MKDKISMPIAVGLVVVALIAVILGVRYFAASSAAGQADPEAIKAHANPAQNYSESYKNRPQGSGRPNRGYAPPGGSR